MVFTRIRELPRDIRRTISQLWRAYYAGVKSLIKILSIARDPLTSLRWFRESQTLAVADTMYHLELGVVSHQPNEEAPSNTPAPVKLGNYEFRMMDVKGEYHIIKAKDLYVPSFNEKARYWVALEKSSRKKYWEKVHERENA